MAEDHLRSDDSGVSDTSGARRGASGGAGLSKRSSARRRDRVIGEVLYEILESSNAGENHRSLAERARATLMERLGSAPDATELERLIGVMGEEEVADHPDATPLDEVIEEVLGEVVGTRAGEGHLALAYRAHEMIQARSGTSPDVRTLQAWIHGMDEGKGGDTYE